MYTDDHMHYTRLFVWLKGMELQNKTNCKSYKEHNKNQTMPTMKILWKGINKAYNP